jgi:5-methylcytosine-specific restriction endonuclease McrA
VDNIPFYRKDKTYLEWREKVFKRDRFTCQFCGSKGGKIEAHHMNSYDTFLDERCKLDNGTTLCIEHHADFHEVFGKGSNTKEQFEEFLKNRTYKDFKMKRLF